MAPPRGHDTFATSTSCAAHGRVSSSSCIGLSCSFSLWGFITLFFRQHSSWVAEAAGVLISAVLLWDVLFRANLGISLSFLEEMWSRNLGQIFVQSAQAL